MRIVTQIACTVLLGALTVACSDSDEPTGPPITPVEDVPLVPDVAPDVTDTGPEIEEEPDTGPIVFDECLVDKCPEAVDKCEAEPACPPLATCFMGCVSGDAKCSLACAEGATDAHKKAAVDLMKCFREICDVDTVCGDELCGKGEDETSCPYDCATPPTCEEHCDDPLTEFPCGCTLECLNDGSCCKGFKDFCSDLIPDPTCEDQCGAQQVGCWCDDGCKDNNDCCPDYDLFCGEGVCEDGECTGDEDIESCPQDCAPPGPYGCLLLNCDTGACAGIEDCEAILTCIAECPDAACGEACAATAPAPALPLLFEALECAQLFMCWTAM